MRLSPVLPRRQLGSSLSLEHVLPGRGRISSITFVPFGDIGSSFNLWLRKCLLFALLPAWSRCRPLAGQLPVNGRG